jgi:hypothetical protein
LTQNRLVFYSSFMPVVYIKLKNPSETVSLQSILGTYCHTAWIRSEDPDRGIIKLITTEDTLNETLEILKNLKNEIEFDELTPTAHPQQAE